MELLKSKEEIAADKKEQAELKAEYLDLIDREVWPNSPDMQDYTRKRTARVIRLPDGLLLAIDKPRIETRFCFGYSDNIPGDYEGANRAAAHAAQDQDYFLRKNMERFDEFTRGLDRDRFRPFIRVHYCGSPAESRLCAVDFAPYGYDPTVERSFKRFLTEQDEEIIRAAYALERQAFEKRLRAYLKRYGMTKVETWSYWRDA